MSCDALLNKNGKLCGFSCSRSNIKPKQLLCSKCGKPATKLCDYRTGFNTCDTPMCNECTNHVGEDIDYCDKHCNEFSQLRTANENIRLGFEPSEYQQKIIEEANTMGNYTELATTEPTGITERHSKAIKLHEGIRADVRIVAQGLSDIGKKLKQMRDDKLYTELGHETFADYGKAMLGLEQRQLYSYVQIFETYGARFIDEHAELGISKLLLLTNVPATEREGFIADNDIESVTVRELREMTEKYNKAAEQLTLLGEEKEDKATEIDHLNDDVSRLVAQALAEKAAAEELAKKLEEERQSYSEAETALRRQLKELESRPIDVAVQEPSAELLEQIRTEEAAKAKEHATSEITALKQKQKEKTEKLEKQAAQEVAAAEDKAKAAIQAAQKTADTAAAEQIKASLTSIEREKAEALARAAELEKKLSLAASNELIKLNILFEQMQELADKVRSSIASIADDDPEQAQKLRTAAVNIIETLKERV